MAKYLFRVKFPAPWGVLVILGVAEYLLSLSRALISFRMAIFRPLAQICLVATTLLPYPSYSQQSNPKPLQQKEISPFINMMRNIELMADEVLADKNTKSTDGPKNENAAPNILTPNVSILPVVKTTQPPETDKINKDPKVEEKKIPQELPKLEMPNPDAPEVKSLPTTSITDPKGGNESGMFSKIFNNKPEGKQNDAGSPPQDKNISGNSKSHKKKKSVELPKPVEPPLPPPVIPGALKNGDNPVPNARPDSNYKTQALPDSISKKNYMRENEHLPPAAYTEEYKRILFDSAASGNLDVLRTMVDNFKDTEVRDADGDTPLIYATMAGNIESVVSLISMGANVNARNQNGVSPLYVATKLGRIDLVMYILEHTDNVDITDKNDKTPLMLASETDFSRIASLLVKSGADINKKMKNGDTPVHFAASNNSVAVMYLLITKGADVEKRNFKGDTPLMLAVEGGQEKVVALLLNAGADITKTNVKGVDISQIAQESSNQSVIDLVESEKIKREILADKLINARKTEVIKEDIIPLTDMLDPKAVRVNGLPVPVFKVKYNGNDMPKTKAKGKKPSKVKKKVKPPKPYFSPEQVSKMKKAGG